MKIGGGSRHLQPNPKGTQPQGGEPGKLVSRDKPVAEPGYHNLSLLVWFIGCVNEAMVVVEGVETMALIDTESQVSTLTEEFYSELRLRILPLGGLLHLNGTGGIAILYKGYMEANLIIPSLPWYNKDMLFLVILDNRYGERVPVQLGTMVIYYLVVTMTNEELQQARDTWKEVHSSTVVSRRNTVESLKNPLVQSQRGEGQNLYDEGSCNSTICNCCGDWGCKIDDTFKMHECSHWANYRLFRPHRHSEIVWHLETRSRQNKWLSKKS